MNIAGNQEWNKRYPRWRAWHTALLYISGLGLALLGIFIVYYSAIAGGNSSQLGVGCPFIIAGIGLILRIPLVIWLVAGLCVVHSCLRFSRLLLDVAAIPGNQGLMRLFPMNIAELIYGILMIIGVSQRRKDEKLNQGMHVTPEAGRP